ncbi:3'-5' exonuclease [Desertivirga xinjiangensis]|uniref:3'-5' exonuclease n=1 Tax=Desertivirga xinjiangensis TaxID=539206 RepID=UPI00210B3E5C|nr:3'-5' exonuclease [Pedobacter xinjiangensis]
MKLNLKRPLAFFDLEATGINLGADRIVEIAILKVLPDGSQEMKVSRINPEIPIPYEISLIHGIFDEDLKDAPTFKDVAQEFADFLNDCDLAGYNSNKFDIPMLMEEFLRAGVEFELENRHFVDVQNIFHQMEQRTLKAAYKFYCGKNIENAHSAEADIRATYEVLLAQLDKYKDTEWEDKKGNKSVPVKNDVEALHSFTNLSRPVDFAGRIVFNEHGIEVFNFGKHKGKCVEEVFTAEPSYYAWMQQGEFPLYTKKCLEKIWVRWNGKKVLVKQETTKTVSVENAEGRPKQDATKPYYQKKDFNPGFKKPEKADKAEPITSDMLDQLKLKFGK